jgi:hypothetical protein
MPVPYELTDTGTAATDSLTGLPVEAAAELVLDLAVGPEDRDKAQLIRWLTTTADEWTVIEHIVYAAQTTAFPTGSDGDVVDALAAGEERVARLVNAARLLLARFR